MSQPMMVWLGGAAVVRPDVVGTDRAPDEVDNGSVASTGSTKLSYDPLGYRSGVSTPDQNGTD